MATNQNREGSSCRSAVMAAMEVIEEECGDDRRPVELDGETVAMMPQEERQRKEEVDIENASPEEVDRLVNGSDWLSSWSESMCRQAGIPRDSPEFKTCQRNFARKALD